MLNAERWHWTWPTACLTSAACFHRSLQRPRQSFPLGLCICVQVYLQRRRLEDKAESSFSLYIVVRLRKNKIMVFIAEEMVLSRINMTKSFYQLHNGQATWHRSKQHHPRWADVCRCIYSTCVCSYLQFIYNLSKCMHAHSHMCVSGSVSMCVHPGSFNQRLLLRRCGSPVSLFFLR